MLKMCRGPESARSATDLSSGASGESPSLSRRYSSRLTLVRCHLPPRAVGISLVQFANDGLDGDNARFPKFTNCRPKGLSPYVRAPLACPSLFQLLDVIKPSRVSILTTVMRCQLPPRAVGILLRFNSSAGSPPHDARLCVLGADCLRPVRLLGGRRDQEAAIRLLPLQRLRR